MKIKSKNRLLTNMLTYAILQIVNMLVGLFLPRLYLSVYGSEVNGVVSTINSFTTYFSYLEAGLGLTLIHSLFKPLAENDFDSTNGILSYSKKQYHKISFVYLILVVALSLTFPFLKITNDIGRVEFIFLVLVIGLYGAIDFYSMAKYRVLLTADRKEYVISNAMILAQVLRFVFVWILLQFNLSIVFVKIVPIFTLFIRSIVLRIYISKKYPKCNFSTNSDINVSFSKNRWDALLLQISISTSISLPTIVVSQVLGYREANVFAVYCLVVCSLISLTSALSSGVAPMLGRAISQGKNINSTYEIFDFIVAVIISIVFSITVIMLLPFVKLYTNVVDDINYIHPSYALLMSIWGALHVYRIPVTAVINAAGIYRENRVNNIANLLIQIVGLIIGAVLFGIKGVIVVMIIASLHRNISLTKVNNNVLLHFNLKKCLLYQLLITIVIVSSFAISYNIISNIEFSICKWILIAVVVSVIEILINVIVFSVINSKTTKKIFEKIKTKT